MCLCYLFFQPIFVRAAVSKTGYESGTTLESTVLNRLLLFQFYNQFFVFTVASVVFAHWREWAGSPVSLAFQLASVLPSVAVFFMLLIAFYALASNALELTRLGTLTYWWVMQRWVVVTPQQLNDVEEPSEADLTYLYSQHILVFLLVLVCALAHPLVLAFALLYYAAHLLVYRHQLVHVYRARPAAQVNQWPQLYGWCMIALLIAQCAYFGLMSLKVGVMQILLSFPLPVITAIVWLRTLRRYHQSAPAFLDLDTAQRIDQVRRSGGVAQPAGDDAHGGVYKSFHRQFEQPAFRQLYTTHLDASFST